jgi:hypothetical protein
MGPKVAWTLTTGKHDDKNGPYSSYPCFTRQCQMWTMWVEPERLETQGRFAGVGVGVGVGQRRNLGAGFQSGPPAGTWEAYFELYFIRVSTAAGLEYVCVYLPRAERLRTTNASHSVRVRVFAFGIASLQSDRVSILLADEAGLGDDPGCMQPAHAFRRGSEALHKRDPPTYLRKGPL